MSSPPSNVNSVQSNNNRQADFFQLYVTRNAPTIWFPLHDSGEFMQSMEGMQKEQRSFISEQLILINFGNPYWKAHQGV